MDKAINKNKTKTCEISSLGFTLLLSVISDANIVLLFIGAFLLN